MLRATVRPHLAASNRAVAVVTCRSATWSAVLRKKPATTNASRLHEVSIIESERCANRQSRPSGAGSLAGVEAASQAASQGNRWVMKRMVSRTAIFIASSRFECMPITIQ
jgi:hypothetical protein